MENTKLPEYTEEQMLLINELVMAKMELNRLWDFHPENEQKMDIVEQYDILKETVKEIEEELAQTGL